MKEWFRRQPKHFRPASRESGQQIPENMWVKCPSCGELKYAKQLNDSLKVCTCGYHMSLAAREWLMLLDRDSFEEDEPNKQRGGATSILHAITGNGKIEGHAFKLFVCDFLGTDDLSKSTADDDA